MIKIFPVALLLLAGLVLPLQSAEILSRQPLPPFTPSSTKIYRLPQQFDLDTAVIVPNDDKDGMTLALKLQDFFQKKWKITLPIRRVSGHWDGRENLILCGLGMGNILSRELAVNQQIARNTEGAEVRILPEALDWKRGVILLAGRNETEVMTAAEALVKRYPEPRKLNFTIDVLHPVTVTEPGVPVAKAKAHFNSHEGRKISVALDTYLKDAFENFRATGDERHVRAFSEILALVCDRYPNEFSSTALAPTFEFHLFPQYLYLLENSSAFSDSDRVKSAEFIRAVVDKALGTFQLIEPAKAYAEGRQEFFTNHYCFASRTAAISGRYLLSRYDYSPAKYFLAVGDNTFEGVRKCPLSPEDAGGYQYLAFRICMDYLLSAGKFSQDSLNEPEFKEYLEYAKSLINHLGYTPGYGDAMPTGMRGSFDLLHDVAEASGDEESAQLLSLILRTVFADSAVVRRCREWGIAPDLPPIADARFNGLRTMTVNTERQRILGLGATENPKLDKAVFRSSWQPDAEFLAVNGLNGSPHGHDDASGISQYLVGPHLWLFEGSYIRRAAEDHNVISIVRNGAGLSRQRNLIPPLERFAQIVGQVQSQGRDMALLSLVIEKCNGVDYYRHFAWEDGGGLWVIDELRAVDPGDYRFVGHWRTTGDITSHEQGVIAVQGPSGNDGGCHAFSIAEGTGTARFAYSEFERTHGRGNRSLIYPLSDGTTRTLLYWKDAVLATGDVVLLVQHFRAIPGAKPEAVKVKELSPGTFVAGNGAQQSMISLDGGLTLHGRHGHLALSAKDSVAAKTGGVIHANRELVMPPDVRRSNGVPIATLPEQISAVAGALDGLAVGLTNGDFLLLDKDGKTKSECRFPGEISVIAAIPTPSGECYAVGCRPSDAERNASGTLYFIDGSGRELWKKEIPSFRRRPGTPTTIFPARLNGGAAPCQIVVGAENWHYYAFDLNGKKVLEKEVFHGATVGAAVDFDGDGRDEIYGGDEYYWRELFDAKGKSLSSAAAKTTSPWDLAVVFGAVPVAGSRKIFAARTDGFLYTVAPDGIGPELWSVRLSGPAHGLALAGDRVAAATINGYVHFVKGDGVIEASVKLPAPLTGLIAFEGFLYSPGLDGKVYVIDSANGKVRQVIDCASLSGMERFFPRVIRSRNALFAVFGNRVFLLADTQKQE